MKITVEFDNEDEFEAFKTSGKKTRGSKKDDTNEGGTTTGVATGIAPAPMQPPAGGTAGPDMGAQFGQQGGGFPGAGASFPAGPSPEAQALVARIVAKTDSAIAGGQNAEQARSWFAGQCGPEAANATLDQIKSTYLPKMTVPQLTSMAALLAA